MLSFFKSIFKTENPEEGISPPSMSVTMHPSTEFSEMSNLSTTSVVGALNSLGSEMQRSLHNMQMVIEKGLHGMNQSVEKGFQGMNQSVGTDLKSSFNNLQKCMEKGFFEVNQSLKESGSLHRGRSLLLGEKYNHPFIGDGVENVAPSIDANPEKTDFYIEFQIEQPDGPPTHCKILPPKYILSIFGAGKRQHELRPIGTDPLKLLLACAFKTFFAADRIILPVLLECEDNRVMPSGDMKELWLQGCLKWFPNLQHNKGKFAACAIVRTGLSPVFVVFSYAFSDDSVKPKLTAYVSDKKVITVKFPSESIGGLFMELMCVRELAEESGLIVEEVEFKTVAFLDQPASSFSEISELFPLHDKDFHIDFPKENWKMNDYSLAVHGVVVFSSKKLNGKMLVPNFNVFKELGVKLEKAVGTKDVLTFRKAICEVLYIASLKLVRMKGAKLLTDADGNHISDNTDLDGVLAGFDSHVADCLGMVDGKTLQVYCIIPVFFIILTVNFVIQKAAPKMLINAKRKLLIQSSQQARRQK